MNMISRLLLVKAAAASVTSSRASVAAPLHAFIRYPLNNLRRVPIRTTRTTATWTTPARTTTHQWQLDCSGESIPSFGSKRSIRNFHEDHNRIYQTHPHRHRSLSSLATASSLDAIDDGDDENEDDDLVILTTADDDLAISTCNKVSSLSQDKDDEQYSYSSPTDSIFTVTAKFSPTGDQPRAIHEIVQQLQRPAPAKPHHHDDTDDDDDNDNGEETKNDSTFCILQGATGTGKTLVMSHVIARMNRPCLVLCHNKTLAAQVARELRSYLKENEVTLFVSHYDYYKPEAYIETTGKYLAKKSSANTELDALRHQATRALLTRDDVVVVASVSCIYGLGLPKDYLEASAVIRQGDTLNLFEFMEKLEVDLLFTHNEDDDNFERGHYQTAGVNHKVFTIWEPHSKYPMTIDLVPTTNNNDSNEFTVQSIRQGRPSGLQNKPSCRIFPAKHHATPQDRLWEACEAIEYELRERYRELTSQNKLVEASRLEKRVLNDLASLRVRGFCQGMENYSRHLAGREAGEAPDTLMDYLGLGDGSRDWLLLVDESHVTLSQLKAMYHGDRSRKEMLVKHGFRLPSALDNRPLKEQEFWKQIQKAVFVSATPGRQELSLSHYPPVEMMIRPTWVCDPIIEVRPPHGQLDDLMEEIKARIQRGERTLALSLTKRDAEDLSSFLIENQVKSTYIHSGLPASERANALRALQTGQVDCLVGVNLLREGLDLPQVSLVAVLNADANGFLRSDTALLQIVGRAARNIKGTAIFYAKEVTPNMKKCMEETARRRHLQLQYNEVNGCEMRTTAGSSTLSIFDIFKEEIEAERELEYVGNDSLLPQQTVNVPVKSVKTTISTEKDTEKKIDTDHIPSSPGVYFWKDENDRILYIGKAKKLRSRVKSYLSLNTNHCPRIQSMISNAASVEFIITPSDRDALVLESNLIKHHQPPFNVLLKDDSHYPYICASVGDAFPRFFIAPRRDDPGVLNQRYRYFGPYTSFNEINTILDSIEDVYQLRSQSFMARHGSGSKEVYQKLFEHALDEVFGGKNKFFTNMRQEFEEAGDLFDSKFNRCCDVVTVAQHDETEPTALVHVLQLRNGLIAGQFSYSCDLPCGLRSSEDYSAVIQAVLQAQHYPSCLESTDERFPWFPEEILLSHPVLDAKELQTVIQEARSEAGSSRKKVSIRLPVSRGERKDADIRALKLASENAQQVAHERAVKEVEGSPISTVDGRAAAELSQMLSLDKPPKRIECFDISHTMGEYAVGSRVVFVDGKPVKDFYRRFNIKTVEGIDDYASLAEVIERRFRRAGVNGVTGPVENEDDPWALPDVVIIDGGPGQLNAAIKAMANAQVFPHKLKVSSSMKKDGRKGHATVAVCALAKSKEQVYVVGNQEPVNQSPDSPGLLLLRALRDESHRFALASHRKRRSVTNDRSKN